MARVNLEVKDKLYERFRDNCSLEGLGVSEVIRGLMVEYNRKRNLDRYLRREDGFDQRIENLEVGRELLTERRDD